MNAKVLWIVYAFVTFLLGVIQTIPISILIPTALDEEVTTTQAFVLLACGPLSSLPAMLLQPLTNAVTHYKLLLVLGVVETMSLSLFYVLRSDRLFYCGCVLRLIGGVAHFMIGNRVSVLLANLLENRANLAVVTWDVFSSSGQALGAYVGAVVSAKVGFHTTMLIASMGIFVITVITTNALKIGNIPHIANSPLHNQPRILYRLHFNKELLLYGWIIMFLIGACMTYTEGVLSQFYKDQYHKSLKFGGFLLGISGVLYSISSAIFGVIGDRLRGAPKALLIFGQIGVSVCLVFLGPWIPVPGSGALYVSVGAFLILLVFSAAVQLNTITVAVARMSRYIEPALCMAIVMNVINLSYSIGAFIGPVVGSLCLQNWGHLPTFAFGGIFFACSFIILVLCKIIERIYFYSIFYSI